jgi:uncharacterized protein (TIGR03435 family)
MRTESRELLAVGIFGSKSRIGDRIETLLRRGRTFSPRASAHSVAASTILLAALMLAGSFAPRWIAFAREPGRPSFEVASVKPGDPDNHEDFLVYRPGGRLTTANATLRRLIGAAYDLRNHQISGGPNWLNSATFDIEAKAGSDVPIPQMRLRLQSLLAERFKLAVHHETREEQVYRLLVDKGGSKLKEATVIPKGQGIRGGKGQIMGIAADMKILGYMLSQKLGRSVIDETGLTGVYDFTLTWPPPLGVRGGTEGPEALPQPDTAEPSIFTALQEDLGLKLQSAKGPVDILVIDHVEKPDAN